MSGASQTTFSADASNSSVNLQINSAAAAGRLIYNDGSMSVTLTDWEYSLPLVNNLDRVTNYNNAPDGINDFVGEFTIVVVAVPEPSSFLLMGATVGGLGILALARGKRRTLATGAIGTSPLR